MKGYAVLRNVISVSQSRIGLIGAPRSFSVCDMCLGGGGFVSVLVEVCPICRLGTDIDVLTS